jgi:hypothetical protein
VDEAEKERLAQALKGQLAGAKRMGPSVAPVRPPVSPDVTPFAIAACAANPHLHRHIDEALREADPAWDALASGSTLLRHAALTTLSTDEAVYAYRLAGVVLAAAHDLRAHACLEEVVRHGWRRVWQTVSAGESISLERLRELHPGKHLQGLDVELVVLVWYAGVCGVPVAESPVCEALDMSLVRELHHLATTAADVDPAGRSRYNAALRYVCAWRRATHGDSSEQELAARLAGARDVVRQATQMSDATSPVQGDVWQAALLLAGADTELDDGTAVSMLAGLFAMRHGSVTEAPVQARSVSADDVEARDEELRRVRADLTLQQREAHRLAGELDRARERLSGREAEISRLMGILSARDEPELEVQYAVRTISERVLVAGGHETLSRNLQAWLPDSVCIATNGKENLDPSVLAGVRLVVVLTSYISHSFSGKVINEAHKRDVPLLLLDWRSAKHILQEIDRALTAQNETEDKQ